MRRKLFRGGMAWRLLVALILALCLVSIGSSPVAALSAEDLFNITYEVSLSETEINGSEIFYATIKGEARCKEDLEFLYSLVTKVEITSHIIAKHNGTEKPLSDSYTVTIEPIPQKKDDIFEIEEMVIPLQFPAQSESGNYDVFGKLDKAIAYALGVGIVVTDKLPQTQFIGSVTYTAPEEGGGGVSDPALTPTGEEVKTNLFGTEASFPISSSGEILQTIEATSEDRTLTLTIAEGTIALDKDDNPLTSLEAEVDTSPPPPPKDASIIGLAYDFGPDGATFDPPITLTRSYDPHDLLEGVAEEDLVLAWYDEAGDQWVELDSVVDTENNTITAAIEHFTTFVIMGKVTSAPESEPEVSVAVFRISELDIYPDEADIGQTVTINVLVTNSGNLEGTYQVTLEIDNKVVETQGVTLAGGASDIVTFKISENIASIYSVNINGLTGSFIVKPVAISEPELAPISTPPPVTHTPPPVTHTPPPAKPINWLVVYGVVVALVAMGSLLLFLARRRHTKSSS